MGEGRGTLKEAETARGSTGLNNSQMPVVSIDLRGVQINLGVSFALHFSPQRGECCRSWGTRTAPFSASLRDPAPDNRAEAQPPPGTRIPRCWRLYLEVPGHLPTQPPQPHFTPFFQRALHCSEGNKGGNPASSFFHRYVFLLVLSPSGRIKAAITLHLR